MVFGSVVEGLDVVKKVESYGEWSVPHPTPPHTKDNREVTTFGGLQGGWKACAQPRRKPRRPTTLPARQCCCLISSCSPQGASQLPRRIAACLMAPRCRRLLCSSPGLGLCLLSCRQRFGQDLSDDRDLGLRAAVVSRGVQRARVMLLATARASLAAALPAACPPLHLRRLTQLAFCSQPAVLLLTSWM